MEGEGEKDKDSSQIIDNKVVIDADFLTSRQYDMYDKIVQKMMVNWRSQLTIILVALSYAYKPEDTKGLLGFFKIPPDTFVIFVAYVLPITFIYFGFFLGRYIGARATIENMLLNSGLVPTQHEAVKLTDGLFVFDIAHRFIALDLPIIAKITHAIATLFVIIVVSCNHVLSFKYALDAGLFPEYGRYFSNVLLICAILLCYWHFASQLPDNDSIPYTKFYSVFCVLAVSISGVAITYLYPF